MTYEVIVSGGVHTDAPVVQRDENPIGHKVYDCPKLILDVPACEDSLCGSAFEGAIVAQQNRAGAFAQPGGAGLAEMLEPSRKTKDRPSRGAKRIALQREANFTNPERPGRHSLLSPVVGTRAGELLAVKRLADKYSAVASFAEVLHRPENVELIPVAQREPADRISADIFESYVRRYAARGLTPQNAVEWVDSDMPGFASNKTWIHDRESEWTTWNTHPIVERRGTTGTTSEATHYLPGGLVALHELMHVEETKKGEPDGPPEIFQEVMTTAKSLILADEVYKRISALALDAVVDYGKAVQWNCNSMPIGRLANFLRDLEAKYRGISGAILSPEFLDLVHGKQP